eukprot:3483740-Rhodomonas_salina.5
MWDASGSSTSSTGTRDGFGGPSEPPAQRLGRYRSIPLCFDLTVGRYLRYRYPGTPGMPLHTGVPGPHWASGSEARVLGLYCGSRYLPGYSGVPGYPGSGRTWAPPRIPGYAPMPSRSYRRYPGTRLLFGAAEVQGKMEWECGMHTPVPGVPG